MRFGLGYQVIIWGFLLTSVAVGRTVQISVAGQNFAPTSIGANVGDTIQISFTVGTARFTQSSPNDPCTPLPDGLDSGNTVIPPGAGPKQFTFILNQTSLFYFNFRDGDTTACRNGFVGAIGASASQVTQFIANAKNSPIPATSTARGSVSQPSPSASVVPTVASTAAAPPSRSTPLSSSTTSSAQSQGSSSSSTILTRVSTSPTIISTETNSSPTQTRTFTSPISTRTSTSPTSTRTSTSPTSTSKSSDKSPVSPSASNSSDPDSDNGSSTRQAALAVVGGLLAMIGVGIIIVVIFFVRRKRERARLALISSIDPFYQNPRPRDTLSLLTSSSFLRRNPGSTLSLRSWKTRSTWRRLDEEERGSAASYISPSRRSFQSGNFRTENLPPVPPMPPPKAFLGMLSRRTSEATLVLSVHSEQTGQTDLTTASLIVNIPGYPEKTVDLRAYPFVSPTSDGSATSPIEKFLG